jgi:hypothetical protein
LVRPGDLPAGTTPGRHCVDHGGAGMWSSSAGRHNTPMNLAGSLGLSCVRARLAGGNHRYSVCQRKLGDLTRHTPGGHQTATLATRVQHEDHRNALDRRGLQRTPALAMAQAQRCHSPASAPEFRPQAPEENRRQLSKNAAQWLRQTAPVFLAVSSRISISVPSTHGSFLYSLF